jgi:hypothetical protein
MTKRDNINTVATRREKTVPLLILIVLVVIAAGLVFIPYGTRYLLTRWLIDNGADEAIVEQVTINPFTGRVSLQGVDVTRNGKVVLSHSAVSLDLGLRQLFSREVMIKRSELSNLFIDIERSADNVLRIGSYSLPESSGEPSVDQTVTTSAPWIFQAREVHFDNVVVRYAQPGLALDLRIDQAVLEKFSTDPTDSSGQLRFNGSLNDAPLSVLLNKLAIATGIALSGRVELGEFPLDTFAEMLAQRVQPIAGTIDLAGDFNLSLSQSAEMSAAFDGSISLADTIAGSAGWEGSGELNWQGVLSGSGRAGALAVNADGVLTTGDAVFQAGTTRISGGVEFLQISGKTALTLSETTALETTTDIAIGHLTAVLAEHSLTQKSTSWKGQLTLDTGQGHTAVGATGSLTVDDLAAESTGFTLTQQSLLLDGEATFSLADAVNATFQGSLKLEESTLGSETISFFSQGLNWQGDLGYTSSPATALPQVTLHGTLTAADSRLEQQSEQHKVFLADLALKTNGSLHLGTAVEPFGTAHLQTGRLTAADGEAQWLSLDSLMVDGSREEATDQLTLSQILVEKVHLPPSAYQAMDISLESLGAEDIVASIDFRNSSVGTLHLSKPTIIDPKKAAILAEIDELTITSGTVEDYNSLHVESLRSGKGAFLTPQRAGGQTPKVSLGSLTLDDFTWHPEQGAAVQAITFFDLNGTLVKNREPAATGETIPAPADPGETTEISSPQSTGYPLKIGRISIAGKSGLLFNDLSLTQPFTARLAVKKAEIAAFDLRHPEEPIAYEVEATVDDYAPLKISGKVAPLAATLYLTQQTRVQNYPLANLSPYVVQAIGTQFESGRLSLQSQVTLADNHLNSDNKLQFREIKAQTTDKEALADFNKALPIPLDTAIILLSDSDRNINLSVPISGKIEDIKVGIGDIVTTALSKSISATVVPYLAYTMLGPTGALAYLGVQMGKTLLSTDYPAIIFAEQGTEPDAQELPKLADIGQGLQKSFAADPDKTISLCPVITSAEAGELGPESLADEEARKILFALGDARAQAVRSHLVDHYQLDTDRLLSCSPRIDFAQDARAMVEFKQ